jgi:fluoride exporter
VPVFVAVGIGGALGALARYGIDRFLEQRLVALFPWSTFIVNVSGCFAAGVVIASLVDRHELPAWARVGLVVGFLGAYTTFSTFAQETWELTDDRHLIVGSLYVAASVAVGVVAVALGHVVGRQV